MKSKTTKSEMEERLSKVASFRKPEIKKRLNEITSERQKHNDALKEAVTQKRRLMKSLDEIKVQRKQDVDKILEDNFLSKSEKGLLDKVLTSKIKEPKLHQLNDSIQKLEAQEEWHRKKHAELAKEEIGLHKELSDIDADELTIKAYEAFQTWQDRYFKTEKLYDEMRDSIIAARRLDHHFENRLSRLDVKDDIYMNLVGSRLPASLINIKNMAVLVGELAVIYGIEDNPFYDDPANPKRRLEPNLPHVRENFIDNQTMKDSFGAV